MYTNKYIGNVVGLASTYAKPAILIDDRYSKAFDLSCDHTKSAHGCVVFI